MPGAAAVQQISAAGCHGESTASMLHALMAVILPHVNVTVTFVPPSPQHSPSFILL